MNPYSILFLIIFYFALLVLISYFVRGNQNNTTFFAANKNSPWYLVAFGMVGATLSGVTFISVPGWVEASKFSYMQMVFGYILGYFIIGTVLMPLYYRLKLTSIYSYLDGRFGSNSYITGASFFLLSRIFGASFRLYLVANVLQLLVFDSLSIPFWVTVLLTIIFIWVYTFQSGIKTIVWTDTLQTFFMLMAMICCIVAISNSLGLSLSDLYTQIKTSPQTQIFFFDNFRSSDYFWKQFLSGTFIAIVMTGLDQDMMQKNLTCNNLKDAQRNMFWFTIVLVFVKFIFLSLGYLLLLYIQSKNIDVHRDELFPTIAMLPEMGVFVSGIFILGLIAAAYSSADSALTAMTTTVSIDFFKINTETNSKKDILLRKKIHVILSFVLIAVILIFKYVIADASVIEKIFTFAGYTYGPLLGLYTFGLLTKWKIRDRWVVLVCLLTPFFGYVVATTSKSIFNFDFGFFILILNGTLTFLGLLLIRIKQKKSVSKILLF